MQQFALDGPCLILDIVFFCCWFSVFNDIFVFCGFTSLMDIFTLDAMEVLRHQGTRLVLTSLQVFLFLC